MVFPDNRAKASGLALSAAAARQGSVHVMETVRPKSIASQSVVRHGPVFGLLFFGVFLLVGSLLSYFLLWRPWTRVQAAKTWPAHPCTVVSSRVRTHNDSDSTTYRVEIVYVYEVNGREFRSHRYKFMGLGGSFSGYAGKAAIVQQYPPGRKTVCYVNPLDPADAVLERGFTAEMWMGAIPLAFMLAGVAGVFGTLRSRRQPGDLPGWNGAGAGLEGGVGPGLGVSGAAASSASLANEFEDPAAARVLKPSGSRVGAFIFLLVFTSIWNGILYFGFIRHGVLRGRDPWGWIGTLFSVPFLLVGIAMLAITVYQSLALFNPKAELTIEPGAPRLGASLEVSWRLTGRTDRLRGLKLFLEGREEATYRQGTRTETDRQVFLTLNVADLGAAADLANGATRFTLPADSVPSFRSTNNRIIWAIDVRGDIPRWPDLKEEFEIQVRPGARMAMA